MLESAQPKELKNVHTSDFRNSLKIEYQGEPFIVVEFQHVKPERVISSLGRKSRVRSPDAFSMRPLSPEKVGKPDIEEKDMQYLYKEASITHAWTW